MATIRYMAGHGRRGQRPVCGGAELRNRGGRSFVAGFVARVVAERQATAPFWEKQRWRSPELRMQLLPTKRSMRFGSSTREWPGVSFFVPLKKEWSATYEGERRGCGCSVDACGGSIVDWRTAAFALFLCMDQRVNPPKCLWQMPVALQSEAAPRFGQWVRTGRTWKWSIDVGWWRNESTRFVLYCSSCVKPSPFVTEDFVGKASVTTALTIVAR